MELPKNQKYFLVVASSGDYDDYQVDNLFLTTEYPYASLEKIKNLYFHGTHKYDLRVYVEEFSLTTAKEYCESLKKTNKAEDERHTKWLTEYNAEQKIKAEKEYLEKISKLDKELERSSDPASDSDYDSDE